jgi:hypothetical protein
MLRAAAHFDGEFAGRASQCQQGNRVYVPHKIAQSLLGVLRSFDHRRDLTQLNVLGGRVLRILWAFRPLELFVGDDGCKCHEEQAGDTDDQGSDPVLELH